MSQQICQLEEELGVTLLQRNSRPVRLTEAGELFLARAHPLAARRDVALAELSDDAFVLYPARPEPSVTGLIVAACKAAGFSPRLAQEVLHLQTATNLIAAGVGVSLVPRAAARS